MKEKEHSKQKATPQREASKAGTSRKKTITDIPQQALDALMEIEAEAVRQKLGLSPGRSAGRGERTVDEGEL